MSEGKTTQVRIWRQKGPDVAGKLVEYAVENVLPEMSFLEMLDLLNEQLTARGDDPVEFDSDCREGICGMCGLSIQGVAHGQRAASTTCELRMRHFDDETITIEPFRARGFPVLKDLVVDRTAFDRIQGAGGFTSTNVGSAPDGNALLVPKPAADKAMDAATCIGCGACVAACPNASASLFVSAKIAQFANLPQGKGERTRRALAMVTQMDSEGFGGCSNHGECEAACPKEISIEFIARMNCDYLRAKIQS